MLTIHRVLTAKALSAKDVLKQWKLPITARSAAAGTLIVPVQNMGTVGVALFVVV